MAMEGFFIYISNKLEAIRFGHSKTKYKIVDFQELKSVALWRAVFAEFMASMIFVYLGAQSAAGRGLSGNTPDNSDIIRVGSLCLHFSFFFFFFFLEYVCSCNVVVSI